MADVADQPREHVVGRRRVGDRRSRSCETPGSACARRVSRQTKAAPACSASPSRLPSAGPRGASCAAASRFCATHSASVRCFSTVALSVDCATARMPAASATARIASATRISTSVKPRCALDGRRAATAALPDRGSRRIRRALGDADAVERIRREHRRRRSGHEHHAYGSLRPLGRNGRIASAATGAPA